MGNGGTSHSRVINLRGQSDETIDASTPNAKFSIGGAFALNITLYVTTNPLPLSNASYVNEADGREKFEG